MSSNTYVFTTVGWIALVITLLLVARGRKIGGMVTWFLVIVLVGMILMDWKRIGPALVATK